MANARASSSAEWRDALGAAMTRSRVQFDIPLRPLTTLRVGGPADALIDLECEADVVALFDIVKRFDIPWAVLGKGSNLLVTDNGVRGVVVRLGRGFGEIAPGPGEQSIVVGAAAPNAQFVDQCRRRGLGGMEFLIAIPGNIGGAIAMNAGAHEGETADYLQTITYFQWGSGIITAKADSFEFAYRSSQLRGQNGRLILGAEFRLDFTDERTALSRVVQYQSYRRETQPRDFPNCGSVFKNPPGDFAARLIEAAGLKGSRNGDAQVSEKHANFIVNRGNAKASDILGLIDTVRKKIQADTGLLLEMELQQLGD